MAHALSYDPHGHKSFEEEWRPHHNCTDIWTVQGLIHESLIPEAMYSYRASVQRVRAGLESFCSVSFSLGDILHAKSFEFRFNIPHERDEQETLRIDADSLLAGDALQVLYEADALALRLRGEGFGLDLRLDRGSEQPFWYNGDKPMELGKKGGKPMFGCVLRSMASVGRLYFADYSMRVEGVASAERLWGRIPLRQAAMHWEHFYLFFNNGDEMMIAEFPYAGHGLGWALPKDKEGYALKDYKLTAVDFLELDEWRFAGGWRLEAPAGSDKAYYLIPLISEQFRLPVSRPTLGIFDRDGNRLGYGVCELLPGARNELKRIPLSMYYDEQGAV